MSKAKQVCLTIPMVGKIYTKSIRPSSEFCYLDGTLDDLLYGYFGGSNAKAGPLNASFVEASSSSEFNHQTHRYYILDINIEIPYEGDEDPFYGLLAPESLDDALVINFKRVHSDTRIIISDQWREWATEIYGATTALQSQVDWTDEKDFVTKFPLALGKFFEAYPDCRCAIIPMATSLERFNLVWVGVTRKSMLDSWASKAEVRMIPSIKVNLRY